MVDRVYFPERRIIMENMDKLTEDTLSIMYRQLSNLKPGSEEHSRLVADISKLQGQLNQDQKMQAELDLKEFEASMGEENKKKDRATQAIMKGVEIVTQIGIAIGGMIFYKKRFHEGLNFEKTGTISSNFGRQATRIQMPKIGKIF